jgi:hypothetical protein
MLIKTVQAQEIFAEAPGFSEVVRNIMVFIVQLIAVLGVIAFVIAGIMYLLSAGKPELAEQAKRYLFYSIIGLSVAIGALVIIFTVQNLLS